MLLRKAGRCPWQDRQDLGPLSTRTTAEKDDVGETTQWSGAVEKTQQNRLHENNADLNHPRSTALGHLIKASANLDNVAKSGLCPTRISALLLWRTLHQILLFPSKEIQWRVSGMERHTDRTRTPTCSDCSTECEWTQNTPHLGLRFSSPGWDFYTWLICVQRWLF